MLHIVWGGRGGYDSCIDVGVRKSNCILHFWGSPGGLGTLRGWGCVAIQAADLQKPTNGADRLDVRRMGLAEMRIASFHICICLEKRVRRCMSQVDIIPVLLLIPSSIDFIMGDGNLFAERNFKQDRHFDFRSCILIDLLERFLNQLNESRDQMTRKTYNVVSNTQAGEYIKSLQGATNTSCDCLLTISVLYMVNKPLLLRIVGLDIPTIRMSLLFPMRFFLTTLNSQNTFWCTTWVSTQTVIFTLRSCASLL